MLDDVIDHLICPVCRQDLARYGPALRCPAGHGFDIARQGYVSLLTGPAGTADTPAMVAARAEFLAAGHYAPLADQLADLVADRPGGARVVADAGAGTGYHLARALPAGAVGIAVDISKHAIRRAARAHPRIGAVVADVWRLLPLRDGAADVLLNVFAPRNGPEFARLLAPGGHLLVVTPAPGHLGELIDRLGLLSVDEEKDRRLAATLSGHFRQIAQIPVETEITLDHAAVEAVVGMGPSAWHTDPGVLRERVGGLPEHIRVPGLFRITIWKPVR